eukprot:c17761_g1_i1.p1 GENE.c17761_g1_i1~~c17761_g1_i1.p1  ORF type:complete len:193 (+),score=47.33 c17761_g1_i1:220-798(+)
MIVSDYGYSEAFVGLVSESIQSQVDGHLNVVDFLRDCGHTQSSVTIKIALRVGSTLLTDVFEWDCLANTFGPEDYAQRVVRDLGISSEFVPRIAHSMHEQIDDHLKNVAQVATSAERQRSRRSTAQKEAALQQQRKAILSNGPTVRILTPDEIIQADKQIEAQIKLRKRNTASQATKTALRAQMTTRAGNKK